MTLGTCCTITVIICSYIPLTLYVREANAEPHASPSLFYAYYDCGGLCLNSLPLPSRVVPIPLFATRIMKR